MAQQSIVNYFVRKKPVEKCESVAKVGVPAAECSTRHTPVKRKFEEEEQNSPELFAGLKVARLSPKKMEQAIIDAGQKNIGPVFCKECQFYYSPHDKDDSRSHNRHHTNVRSPGAAPCFKLNARRLKLWRTKVHEVKICDEGTIYKIDQQSPPAVISQMEDVVETVNTFLGNMTSPTPLCTSRRSLFVFVTQEKLPKIAGVLVAELISRAHILLDGNFGSEEDVPAELGINRIWVVPSHRRKGIASQLVDAARCNMVLGCAFRRKSVAFSDPTDEGRKLAMSYIGSENRILIYAVPS